jgi:hypothetical protein
MVDMGRKDFATYLPIPPSSPTWYGSRHPVAPPRSFHYQIYFTKHQGLGKWWHLGCVWLDGIWGMKRDGTRSSNFLWCLIERQPSMSRMSVKQSGISSSSKKAWMRSSLTTRITRGDLWEYDHINYPFNSTWEWMSLSLIFIPQIKHEVG